MDRADFNLSKVLEQIVLTEELFGTNFHAELESFAPREIVDWLVVRLQGWGPNTRAAALLKELARSRSNPRLADGLHDAWRREQIAAIVSEIWDTDRSVGGSEAPVPVRKPRPKSGNSGAAAGLDQESTSGDC